MANVSDIQNQVREAVKKGQETVTETLKTVQESVATIVPEIKLPEQVPNYIPQAKAAVQGAFEVAGTAVARSGEFVVGVLDTVETRLFPANGSAKKEAAKDTPAKEKAEASV